MPWGVDEANTMRGILQELAARLLPLQNPRLALDAQVLLEPAALGDPFNEGCREVGIEWVGHEDLSCVGICLDSGREVSGEVRLGARRPKGGTDDFADHDIEVRDQTQRSMPVILELDALGQTGPHGFVRIAAFQRLHAGFLIDTHDVRAFAGPLGRIAGSVAESLDIGLILRGRFSLVLRSEHNQVVTSVSSISRVDDARESLLRSTWDLVIVDEAHKMSAYSSDKKTLAFQLGEALSKRTDHLLLMTATPHKGDPENFRLFLSLLDSGYFPT